MALLAVPAAGDQLLVDTGAIWRVLDDGSDQGTTWREPAFNDSTWAAGPAELGYGDGDEATLVSYGPDPGNRYITTWFRHAFVLPSTNDLNFLDLRLRRDDGAVVYLNGTEIWRSNMPTGSIDYLTRAPNGVIGPGEIRLWESFIPSQGLLRPGTNTFAVEVHQYAADSDDLSFDFSCTALERPPPVNLVRGPYLQAGSTTGIVVRWRTDLPTDSHVWYGPAPDALSTVIALATTTTEHVVEIQGLDPETRYYYAVGDAWDVLAGGDTNHCWVTHPLPGRIGPLRVWALGDPGTADQNAARVRDAFTAWTGARGCDLWLMLGDNAYVYGFDSEYQAAVFDMYPAWLRKSVLWLTIGNHDIASSTATESGPYYDNFTFPTAGEAGGVPSGTEAWYAFDYGNAHVVCLNTYDVDRTTNGAMYAWLQADLAANEQDWLIAFFHHPPYTKASHNSDVEVDLIEVREHLVPLLEAYDVDLVLAGHSHSYERSFLLHGHYGLSSALTPGMIVDGGDGRADGDGVYDKTSASGAVYVVAGSSGKISGGALSHPVMHFSTNALASVVFDLSTNRLDFWCIGATNLVLDRFSIVKNVDAHALEMTVEGAGRTTPTSGVYRAGATVPLTARPAAFHAFSGWSGSLETNANPSSLIMDMDYAVLARFDPLTATNGVPLWWLDAYGLQTNDAAALGDIDVDGSFAWQEYVADTNPTNAASRFHIEAVEPGPPLTVRFNGSTQRVYTLEYADDLPAAAWASVPGRTNIAGTGPDSLLTDPGSAPMRTHRLRVTVP